MDSFRDVMDEVDLFRILEEIVAQIPMPFIYEVPLPPPEPLFEHPQQDEVSGEPVGHKPQEESYTIINVQKKPTIIRLPEPPQTAEIEIQTEKEMQDDSIPPPPPPPPLPVQPTVIEIKKSSVENDLVAILNTVVQSNKAAMQGQQAVMLALVQEMAEKAQSAVCPPVAPVQTAAAESRPAMQGKFCALYQRKSIV